MIQPVGIRKLRGNGLTSVDRRGAVRLHDIVYAALSHNEWCNDLRRAELTAALDAYLVATAQESGLRFWATARILCPKLERLVASGARNPAFRYALLLAWDPADLRTELVGDPIADAKLIATPPAPLSVISVIEAIEQLFLHDKYLSEVAADTRLQSRLLAFDILADLTGLTDLEAAQIQHHRAKAYKRLGRLQEAAGLFEAVLASPVPMDEARLQLIDIYRGDAEKMDRAIELVDEILGRVAGGQAVAYSVFLGVVERLPRGLGTRRGALIRRHATAIERTIVEAANVGVQQAFQAFSAVGRYLSTEEPDLFQNILRQLPTPDPASLRTDSERFTWAEILFEAARLPAADSARLHAEALELYQAEVKPQRFHMQRRAELLIDMGKAAEGEALLRSRDDLETNEWIQRLMARARLAQNDPKEALMWIDKALEHLTADHFRSEFLELRFEIRTILGEKRAIEDLLNARAASQKEAETARLDARLEEATRRTQK